MEVSDTKEVCSSVGFLYRFSGDGYEWPFAAGTTAAYPVHLPKLGFGSFNRRGNTINLVKLHVSWVVEETKDRYNETTADHVLGVGFFYEHGATPGEMSSYNVPDPTDRFFYGMENRGLFRGYSVDGGYFGSGLHDVLNSNIRRYFNQYGPMRYFIAPGRGLELFTRGAPYYGDAVHLPKLGYSNPRVDGDFAHYAAERFKQYPSFISSTVAPLYGDAGFSAAVYQACNPVRDACDRSYTIIGSRAAYDDPNLDYPGNPDHDSNWWELNPNHDLIIDFGAENISTVKGISRTDNPAELLLGNHTAPNNVRNRPTPNGVGTGHGRPQATRGITMNEIGASPANSLDPGLFYSNSAQGSAGIQGDLKWQLEHRGHQSRARNICLNMEADGTNFRPNKFGDQETQGSFTIDLQNAPCTFDESGNPTWGKLWVMGTNMTSFSTFDRSNTPLLVLNCRLEFTDEPERKRRGK